MTYISMKALQHVESVAFMLSYINTVGKEKQESRRFMFKAFIKKCTKKMMHTKLWYKWTEASKTPQSSVSVFSRLSVSDERVRPVEMQFWLWVKIQSIPIHSSMAWKKSSADDKIESIHA